MALNPVFELFDQETEKETLQDLFAEAIQIYGFNVFYLPRMVTHIDQVMGEDTQSYFDKAYEIEMYLKNVEGFSDNQDMITPYGGLILQDGAILTVARNTFAERTSGSGLPRPKEGDLIFFPMGKHNNLFEISYVEDETPFYQTGDLYAYDIKIQLFEYSNERFRTTIPQIDAIEDRYVSTIDVTLGSGSGTYQTGETVYQGTDLASATFSAEVLSWSSPIIRLKYTKGEILPSVNLIGYTSAATRLVSSSTTEASTNDPLEDNDAFQEIGEEIIEWDPRNPFGGE